MGAWALWNRLRPKMHAWSKVHRGLCAWTVWPCGLWGPQKSAAEKPIVNTALAGALAVLRPSILQLTHGVCFPRSWPKKLSIDVSFNFSLKLFIQHVLVIFSSPMILSRSSPPPSPPNLMFTPSPSLSERLTGETNKNKNQNTIPDKIDMTKK